MEKSWSDVLEASKTLKDLQEKIDQERERYVIYPPKEEMFAAFWMTPYDKVKVVILGQDPYHGAGQANGLAFSVKEGVKLPPSLRNIFKEREADLGIPVSTSGDLSDWAESGVLLLNTVLTVREKAPGSHRHLGWENFTDDVIKAVDRKDEPCVFILWGKQAAEKEKLLKNRHHLILKAPHPSPLSAYRGFFGTRPFSKTNTFLKDRGRGTIDWRNGK